MQNAIILDDDEISKLQNAAGGVRVIDSSGRVIGVFLPLASGNEDISDEECERRHKEEKRYSTAEVLAYLKALPDVSG